MSASDRFKKLESLAYSGDLDACLQLAYFYEFGTSDVVRNLSSSINWYREALRYTRTQQEREQIQEKLTNLSERY